MKRIFSVTAVVFLSAVLAVVFAARVAAADPIVYPAKGQSETKMNKDKAECQQWAQKQNAANPQPAATSSAQSQPKGGARAKGGARGAAGGAAVGAIGGDAGKGAAIGAIAGGMRAGRQQREAKKENEASAKQAQAQQQQQIQATYDRAFSACMEGRGYTVK